MRHLHPRAARWGRRASRHAAGAAAAGAAAAGAAGAGSRRRRPHVHPPSCGVVQARQPGCHRDGPRGLLWPSSRRRWRPRAIRRAPLRPTASGPAGRPEPGLLVLRRLLSCPRPLHLLWARQRRGLPLPTCAGRPLPLRRRPRLASLQERLQHRRLRLTLLCRWLSPLQLATAAQDAVSNLRRMAHADAYA